MMNYNKRQTRKRRLKRLTNETLEHVAYIVVFGIFVYLFFYMPLSRSMGW